MVRHKRINEPDIRYDGQNLFQLNATQIYLNIRLVLLMMLMGGQEVQNLKM